MEVLSTKITLNHDTEHVNPLSIYLQQNHKRQSSLRYHSQFKVSVISVNAKTVSHRACKHKEKQKGLKQGEKYTIWIDLTWQS